MPARIPGLRLIGIRLFTDDVRKLKALARQRRTSYQVMVRHAVSDLVTKLSTGPGTRIT